MALGSIVAKWLIAKQLCNDSYSFPQISGSFSCIYQPVGMNPIYSFENGIKSDRLLASLHDSRSEARFFGCSEGSLGKISAVSEYQCGRCSIRESKREDEMSLGNVRILFKSSGVDSQLRLIAQMGATDVVLGLPEEMHG